MATFIQINDRREMNNAKSKTPARTTAGQHDLIMSAKKELQIVSNHKEKLKRLIKDPRELEAVNKHLQQVRSNFLEFGLDNF
ncbi:AC29 [Trabala vishnou gigantina nucleopolyhedrovirus]|uniref:AC29 n=1 Tax=Trabala vishnou gigantina nucleopolyhedrovirus TaxID=2863583 RepID=UPI002481C5C1|nr:AC29 [Trabala vishnou gigantina nucleopolyhedrovirus]QYC92784.1 AC29 [Trabala vishnou gigantina nucleopolyhedrovirus]